MPPPKLSPLEVQVMEVLWRDGAQSVRDVQKRLSDKKALAYTTVQTVLRRLELKKAVRRSGKRGGAHIFKPVSSRSIVETRLVDDFLNLFGGRAQPLMNHLIRTKKLTLDDVREAERVLLELQAKRRPK